MVKTTFPFSGVANPHMINPIADNGRLSIFPKAANRPITPADLSITVTPSYIGTEVIMDGRIMGENLRRLGTDEKWLKKQIQAQGYYDAKDILLGIYRKENDTLTLYPNE